SSYSLSFLVTLPLLRFTLFPYTTLFRSSPADSSASAKLIKGVWIPGSQYNWQIRRRWTRWNRHLASQYASQFQSAVSVQKIPRKDRKRHTSELQSRSDLVCRLLLEKKKK